MQFEYTVWANKKTVSYDLLTRRTQNGTIARLTSCDPGWGEEIERFVAGARLDGLDREYPLICVG
jgi:hypothetical protein